MLSVLLVDDEPIIKAAFQKIIPWEEEGYQIAGSASNGKEALRILSQSPADIVITDLKMPQMDGIALIKELKGSGFDGIILVLSNYADFDLVREALVAGATDYMLKVNIDAQMLLDQLHKAREALAARRKSYQKERLVIEHSALLRTHTLRAYLTAGDPPALPPQALADAYSLAHGPFGMCHIAFLPSRNLGGAHFPSPNHVESVLRAIFENVQDTDILILNDREICCVYPQNELAQKGIIEKDKLDQITRQIAMYFNTSVLLLHSPPAETLPELRLKHLKCLEAASLSFYALKRTVLSPESIIFGDVPDIYQAETVARRLAECHIHKENEEIRDYLTFFLLDCRAVFASPGKVKEFLAQTYERLMVFAPCSQNAGDCQNAIDVFTSCRDEQELLPQAIALFSLILTQIVPPAYEHCKEDVRRALLYMHMHYVRQITLDDIACAANLDRSYLCRLFKKETGLNPFAYLNDLRMTAAARIIAEEGVYIQEVAGRVGIDDPFYFTRLFRKRFGQSPSEYRNALES